jgi:hypothetical protein
LAAILAFCQSSEFTVAVRRIDKSLKVTNSTFAKVPFDWHYWDEIAKEKFQEGVPPASSNDPVQWLFPGDPKISMDPLQTAIARMLGYRWPQQSENCDQIEALADADGIVGISAMCGERAAAERLLDVLRSAYGSEWSDSLLGKLLTDTGAKAGTSLDEWLRHTFFHLHCKLFGDRPFIWHIWDGLKKDGFNVLVNYHKFDRNLLEKLIYTYLGDWIARQKAAEQRGESGAEARRLAAEDLQERLKLILEGEKPYDIFVRWKPIEEQPIGWEPDLNDGVRMNIRPFVEAGVLRKNPNIKWTKDRGKEPERDRKQFPWFWDGGVFTGDRVNDVHLTKEQKEKARNV